MEKILILAGPTASGKTELAAGLAARLGGEVVSADSRQVYRGFDAGTAKPPPGERGPLVDCAEPDEPFDAARFADAAGAALAQIRARGKRPIIAGGTGLYLKVLLDGVSALPKTGAEIRRRLSSEAEKLGKAFMHAKLKAVDPLAASRIPSGNIQRTLRALEVYEATGQSISSYWAKGRQGGIAPEERFVLMIHWPTEELNKRIELRARQMWPRMLIEVKELLNKGLSGDEPAFQSLGYQEALQCVRNRLGVAEGLEALIVSTRQYAKRQRTWFRTQLKPDAVIRGASVQDMLTQALAALHAHETSSL